MRPSPYTPGDMARTIPGRDIHMADLRSVFAGLVYEQRLAGRVSVRTGPRGIGKTSLLRQAQSRAEQMGLDTVFTTAGNGVLAAVISDEVADRAQQWGSKALSQWTSNAKVTFSAGFASVELNKIAPPPPEATRAFRELVIGAARASTARGKKGVVFFVDELQSTDGDSLRTILYAWQELQSEGQGVPAALVAAGLSHTSDIVTDHVTFGERLKYRKLQGLKDDAAREAFTQPATDQQVSWDTDALAMAVERAQGYPYFIQLYAHATWQAAGGPGPGGRLTREHVVQAEDDVNIDLSELYRARWAKATPKEREILSTMATIGQQDEVARRDIAKAIDRPTEALSMARRSLLDKGIVDAPRHGYLAFSVPGFAQFIRDELEG